MQQKTNKQLIIDWAKQNKQFLYKLGFIFYIEESKIEEKILYTIEQMKDCFDETDRNFREKFISLFISKSELILKEEKVNDEISERLFKLETLQRQCIFLKYVLNMNDSEVANYLQIDEGMVQKYRVKGLEQFSNENDVDQTIPLHSLLNYHEGKLSFDQYKVVNQQIAENELIHQKLESVINSINQLERFGRELNPSQYFLEPNKPLTDWQKKQRKRKQQFIMATISAFLVIGIFISSIGVTQIGQKWKVWTGEAAHFGEKVFVSALDQNIEITVTHVAADDVQTVLYYEIRDLDNEFNYSVDFHEGFFDIKEQDIWEGVGHHTHSVPRPFSQLIPDDFFNKGRILLPPIKNEQETVTIIFNTVEQIKKGIDLFSEQFYTNRNQVNGEWILEIPIEKREPYIFEINETITIEGQPIELLELEVRPTVTNVKYKIKPPSNEDMYQYYQLFFTHIKANEKVFHSDFFIDSWRYTRNHDMWLQTYSFETFYYDMPESIEIELDRMHTHYDYRQELEINYDQLPMTFNVLDTTVTFSEVEIANPFVITIEQPIAKNRSYDSFHFDFHDDYYRQSNSIMDFMWSRTSEGVYMDRKGNQYESYDEAIQATENPFNIRFMTTKQKFEVLFQNDDDFDVTLLPTKFMINGYEKSYEINEVVKINLK